MTDSKTAKRRNDIWYPCFSCSHADISSFSPLLLKCMLSGTSGIARPVDCLSYKKRTHITDWAGKAKGKVKS